MAVSSAASRVSCSLQEPTQDLVKLKNAFISLIYLPNESVKSLKKKKKLCKR